MNFSQFKINFRSEFLGIILLIFACCLFPACQAPLLSTSKQSHDMALTFVISGSAANGSRSLASSGRLLLANTLSLTVSLTPQNEQLPPVASQTTNFSGPSPGLVRVVFSNLQPGTYDLSAVAVDNSGNRFLKNAAITVGATTTSATLNLVPAGSDTVALPSALMNACVYDSPNLGPGKALSWVMPANATSATNGKFIIELMNTNPSIQCFIQSADGTNLSSTPTSRVFSGQVTNGTDTYITLYNTNLTTAQSYIFWVKPLPKPTGLSLTPGNSKVSLAWAATDEAISYNPFSLNQI